MSERLIRLLAELPPAEPDPAGAERIRMRCRAQLARQAPRASASRRGCRSASSGSATLSRAVMVGRRLKNWNTNPMAFLRRSARWLRLRLVASLPLIDTFPLVG